MGFVDFWRFLGFLGIWGSRRGPGFCISSKGAFSMLGHLYTGILTDARSLWDLVRGGSNPRGPPGGRFLGFLGIFEVRGF